MKVSELFESNYRPNKLRGKSANTVRLYRLSIAKLDRVLGRSAVLDDLTDATIARVMQWCLDHGRSPATANKERSQLLALWRYACRLGLLTKWPTIEPEKEPERVPQAWLVEDVQQLFAAVDKLEGVIDNTPQRIWWKALLSVTLDTGERIGALTQCEWTWLDRGWLLVRAEARKGGRRDRRYKLSAESLSLIAQLRTKHTNLIFYWPFNRLYLWGRYKKILQAAGLPCGRKDKFHRLRKTVASVAYSSGLDAQDILDHQQKRTTQKYLDPRFTRERQASDVLAEWLRTPPKKREERAG